MALSDASDDPLALGNGGHHPLSANGNAPSNTSTPVSNGQDPLTAACSSDCLTADGDEDVTVKDAVTEVQQKQQRSLIVQRANRPSQNGGVVKQNGSLRNLPPSSAASPSLAITDSQRLAKRHLPSTLSPSSSSSSSSPPLQPPPTLLPALSLPLCPLLPLWTTGVPALSESRHRPRRTWLGSPPGGHLVLPLLPLCLHVLSPTSPSSSPILPSLSSSPPPPALAGAPPESCTCYWNQVRGKERSL
ncbi:protein dispatched homolog 1 [Lates japonicus]